MHCVSPTASPWTSTCSPPFLKKDFSDLLLLHQHGLEVRQSLDFFCQKYGEEARFLAIRSLLYFADADVEPDPVYLNGWPWLTVKTDTGKIVQKHLLF